MNTTRIENLRASPFIAALAFNTTIARAGEANT
jgi:hypothetical protein